MASPQVAQVVAGGWELPPTPPDPAHAGGAPCPRCATLNSKQMRFCVGCGQRLAGDDAPPQIAGVPAAQPAAFAQASAPVGAAGLPPGVTVCWRCRGAGDPGAAFCKFCGARYEDAAGAPQPAPVHPVQSVSRPVPIAAPTPVAAAPIAQPGALPSATPWPAPAAAPPGYAPAAAPPAYAAPAAQPAYAPAAAPVYAPAPVLPTAPGGSPIPYVAPVTGEPIAGLVAILKDGSDGRAFPIYSEQADIGRTEGDVILSDDPYLSPRHARLRRRGDGWLLRDLDSANGIYVRIREPVDLVDGDMILLGQQVLRFELLDDGELPLGPATQHGVLMFGTPEVPRMARLTQYTTEGVGRDVHYVYRDETVLGRENGDIVFTDDPFLSRRHAAITADRVSRRFVLRDLGSSNGTAVRFHGERVLAPGDQFRVGRHLFRFELAAGSGGRVGR